MLATWLINPLMYGIYVGLPKGQFFYVITLDQHMIHRRTRVINVKKENPAQGNYSFPQKLSSVEFSVTFPTTWTVNPFAILLGVIRCWLKGCT